MEIIKVVHAETDEETDLNRQTFALENYKFDVYGFLDRDGFDKKNVEDWLEAVDKYLPYNMNGIRAITGKLMSAAGAASKTVEQVDPYRRMARRLAEKVSASVVDDIRNQIERVKVLSLEAAKSRYPRTNNLSVGTYTLHPYDGRRLTRLESYHTNLAMEKDDELIILLGRMGAKTIRIVELGMSSIALSGGIGIGTAPVDIAGKMSVNSQSATGKDLLVSFAGNAVDIDENMLKTSLWFSADSKLNSILDSRRFNPNKIEQYTLTSTYRETFDFDFELAARFMAFNADVKAQYQSLSQKERLFHVEFSKS